MADRDLSELTQAGKHVYERMTMEDIDRRPGDAVQKTTYDPCCIEHKKNQICVLPYGHSRKDVG